MSAPGLNPDVVLAALDNALEVPSTHRMTHLSIMRLRVKRLRDQVAQHVAPESPAPVPESTTDTKGTP